MTTVPVLLDTDIGSDIDDGIALAYLLAEPRCELRGVTTVSGRPRLRAALVDAVCRAGGVTDVPIHAGVEQAIVGDTPQPEVPQASVLERFDHRPADDFEASTAVTFLRDTILAAPGEVTLLTIGPLTNVGLLFATYPDVAPALRSLVIMGGAYSSSRWIGGGQEWNTFCDPTAARIVYRTPVQDHRSLGLNVTTQCTMPAVEVVSRFTAIGGALEVVAAMTEVWATDVETVTFHDPLAAVCALEPDVCTWRGGRVSVELTSRRFRGATSFDVDRDGSPHVVADTVDAARLRRSLRRLVMLSLHDVLPLHVADVTFPASHPLRDQIGEVFAFALRHPTGLVLFETGIGEGNEFVDDLYRVRRWPIDLALEAHGHRVDDVRAIVNSHLHFDHCGNNRRFPGVPIYVQASEYRAAHEPYYTVPEWVDFEDAEYVEIDGDSRIAEGVRVLSTPGHSPGHQSLIFDTAEGLVALAGQAVYSKAEYEHLRTTGTLSDDDPPPDPEHYLASAARLIDLQPRRVHFSHDRAVWETADSTVATT